MSRKITMVFLVFCFLVSLCSGPLFAWSTSTVIIHAKADGIARSHFFRCSKNFQSQYGNSKGELKYFIINIYKGYKVDKRNFYKRIQARGYSNSINLKVGQPYYLQAVLPLPCGNITGGWSFKVQNKWSQKVTIPVVNSLCR